MGQMDHVDVRQQRHQLHNKHINPLTRCCQRLKANAAIVAVIQLRSADSDFDVLGIFFCVLFCLSVHLDELFAVPFHYPPDLLCCFSVRANGAISPNVIAENSFAACNYLDFPLLMLREELLLPMELLSVFVWRLRRLRTTWEQHGHGSWRFNQKKNKMHFKDHQLLIVASMRRWESAGTSTSSQETNHLDLFQASQIPAAHLLRRVSDSLHGEGLQHS